MTFSCTASNPKAWKGIAAAAGQIVEVANFQASPEGLSFAALDEGPFRMLDVIWPSSAFEKYECGEAFKWSVRTEDFNALLGRSQNTDTVTITQDEAKQEGMTLTLKALTSQPKEFTVHLVEPKNFTDKRVKLPYDITFTIPLEEVKTILEDAMVVHSVKLGRAITLRANKEGLSFDAKEDARYHYSILSGDSILGEFTAGPEEALGTYGLDSVHAMVKAMIGVGIDKAKVRMMGGTTPKPINFMFDLDGKGTSLSFYATPHL